jgi:hypothetical protein
MPQHVAEAFVLNFQDESGLNPGINEANPIVPGSRGGFGLYQLTGPRRKAYEAWAGQNGRELADPNAQMDFMMKELGSTENAAWQKISAAPDRGTAAAAVVNYFLRPSEKYRAQREAKYLGGAPMPADMQADGAGRTDRNPDRLAWAYANGKMTPDDAALYEKGMADGVFPKAEKTKEPDRIDPLQVYADTAFRPRAPFQPVSLEIMPVQNATPWRT